MASIQGINPIGTIPSIGDVAKPAAQPDGGKGFGDFLNEAIGQVEAYRTAAEDASNGFMAGESKEIHEVILAGQRAEVAFETFLQVRNKVVQAYQEVMRMQL